MDKFLVSKLSTARASAYTTQMRGLQLAWAIWFEATLTFCCFFLKECFN